MVTALQVSTANRFGFPYRNGEAEGRSLTRV
jgi:hypothetical protein